MPLRHQREFIAENGEIVVGAIPKAAARATAHFHEVAAAITSEWNKRRIGRGRLESPTSWFKRNLYRLIKAYLDHGRADLFLNMARASGRSLVGLEKIKENPFKLALFGMWADNESMTRHQQRVLGTQMLYAYMHQVEPEHLLGFIRLAGSVSRIDEKLKRGAREPGHQ